MRTLWWLSLMAAAPGAAHQRPAAVLDLATRAGVEAVNGQWRYTEARIADGRAVAEDKAWRKITPESLEERRGPGQASFAWYELELTMPARAGAFETRGTTAVFEIVVDDYAEVWVNGHLPAVLGETGGPVIAGYNAPNRVVLSRAVTPGEKFKVGVFAINGPVSANPENRIWVRSATLDFYSEYGGGEPVPFTHEGLDDVIGADATLERLANGFTFTEGPAWHPDGYLLFSDPNENRIYRWSENDGVSVHRTKSGYAGADIGEYSQPGSNGLALDAQGRLTIAEHGRRRIVRIEPKGQVTVLADRFEGKRLNSPNDLVYKSDGALYFTDPPFGLPKVFDDARKELPYSGVFRWKDGQVELMAKELTGPNGIAFSPDERFLYVTNWDEKRKVIRRYPVQDDGRLGEGEDFFSMQDAPEAEALDGLKVDEAGRLFASGPGGVWVISPAGELLGRLRGPELPANLAWGPGKRSLYLTARTGLYRLRFGMQR